MGAWLVYCMITNTYLLNPQAPLELLSTKKDATSPNFTFIAEFRAL